MRLLSAAVLLLFSVKLSALTLDQAQFFSDNAVLQQGVEMNLSGTGTPGTTVQIHYGTHTEKEKRGWVIEADVNRYGRWSAPKIIQHKAGGPYILTIKDGKQQLQFKNILVGEVWLVSGQSNADFPLKRFAPCQTWLKDSNYPQIRYMKVTWQPPHMRKPDKWNICSPETAGNFSATGFFFAKALQKHLNVPVGIVVAAQDGSIIQKWVPENVLPNVPGMPDAIKKQKTAEQKWSDYQTEVNRRQKLPETEQKNLPELKRPPYPAKMYSTLFETQVEPLIPFPIKGVIWYQGESNAMFAQGYWYRFFLTELIREWRKRWNNKLPFLIVQLPSYGNPVLWANLRDSQNYVAANEKNISLVSTLDIGDTKDIHPPKKEELGNRLNLFALRDVYEKKDIICRGPVMQSYQKKGSEMIVKFVPESPIVSRDGQELRGFSLAGADKKFYPAKAEIKDNYTLILTSDKVKEPVAFRYAWFVPENVNFFNTAGNPATAFRSDNWKLETQRD